MAETCNQSKEAKAFAKWEETPENITRIHWKAKGMEKAMQFAADSVQNTNKKHHRRTRSKYQQKHKKCPTLSFTTVIFGYFSERNWWFPSFLLLLHSLLLLIHGNTYNFGHFFCRSFSNTLQSCYCFILVYCIGILSISIGWLYSTRWIYGFSL